MKVAVLADAHGNQHGFFAALEAARAAEPDEIVAAGDMLAPFPGGPLILAALTDDGIHCLRGNGDDRLGDWFRADAGATIRTSPQFRPLQLTGTAYRAEDIEAISEWPISLSFSHGNGCEAVVCHGTPESNAHSIADFACEPEASHVANSSADAIVAGHYHYQWAAEAHGTLLALAGSCGSPCAGGTTAQYAIVHLSEDGVRVEHCAVQYDINPFIRELRAMDFPGEAGPVGWLMLAQTLVARPLMLSYFRETFEPSRGADVKYLASSVRDHLERHEARDPVERVFGPLAN